MTNNNGLKLGVGNERTELPRLAKIKPSANTPLCSGLVPDDLATTIIEKVLNYAVKNRMKHEQIIGARLVSGKIELCKDSQVPDVCWRFKVIQRSASVHYLLRIDSVNDGFMVGTINALGKGIVCTRLTVQARTLPPSNESQEYGIIHPSSQNAATAK